MTMAYAPFAPQNAYCVVSFMWTHMKRAIVFGVASKIMKGEKQLNLIIRRKRDDLNKWKIFQSYIRERYSGVGVATASPKYDIFESCNWWFVTVPNEKKQSLIEKKEYCSTNNFCWIVWIDAADYGASKADVRTMELLCCNNGICISRMRQTILDSFLI